MLRGYTALDPRSGGRVWDKDLVALFTRRQQLDPRAPHRFDPESGKTLWSVRTAARGNRGYARCGAAVRHLDK
ncbi:hypothetical protein [Streptomyces sp. NPDC058739]|uniref:hypothetical protein n=1 Tax=Streptomyces sp. NPDC058739 TaxID=3346618 RepID=UPI0036ABF10B